jgi:3-isopropylmalate/(R)-2-methylmalate dehydratase small subunit
VSSMREPLTRFEGPAVAIARDNVDTDQIIPARFLKTTSRTGLGAHLFADWRTDEDGVARPEFVLNTPVGATARVLVAGWNFGCGSSREHAPWALADFGFRAVVAASFADIFKQNALKNGLLPIQLPAVRHDALLAHVLAHSGAVVGVDLARQMVTWPGCGEAPFSIDAFARECLLAGVDEIGWVMNQAEAITRFESLRTGTTPVGSTPLNSDRPPQTNSDAGACGAAPTTEHTESTEREGVDREAPPPSGGAGRPDTAPRE